MRKFRRTKATLVPEAFHVKKQGTKKIWALIVIVVMAMSVIGFLTIDFTSVEKYNGFKIVNIDGRSWKVAKIPDILFFSHPVDVEQVPVTEEYLTLLKLVPVLFVAVNPTDRNVQTIAAVADDLVRPFAQEYRIVRFITSGNDLFGCENATSSLPVLEFKTGQNRSFARNNSAPYCHTFTGVDARDFVEFRDRVLYGLYGVIPDDTYQAIP